MIAGTLNGKTAVVTGASQGLGLEIARALRLAGARVVLLARDEERLSAAARDIAASVASEAEVSTYPVDLGDEAAVTRFASRCSDDFGPIDILVNNAAIQGSIGPFESSSQCDWHNVFQINFFSPVLLCRAVVGSMRRRGWGKIVQLSGGGATGPRPDFAAYGASKCALGRFSETLAKELHGTGIDVNSVAPGAMNTRMLEQVLTAGPTLARSEFSTAQRQAAQGGMAPAKAAELVAWLASPASDGITGKLISAAWDEWRAFADIKEKLSQSDVYTLRRIVPNDRGWT